MFKLHIKPLDFNFSYFYYLDNLMKYKEANKVITNLINLLKNVFYNK